MLTIHSLKLEEAAISMVWLRSNRLRKFWISIAELIPEKWTLLEHGHRQGQDTRQLLCLSLHSKSSVWHGFGWDRLALIESNS